MGVRVPAENVRLVQLQADVPQIAGYRRVSSERVEQVSDGVPSGLLSLSLENGLDGLLSRLLRGEAGPVEKSSRQIVAGVV